MPTYVYACDTCGTEFEQFQSFKDEPLRTCPSCASVVRRVFQPVGIVFKGSGWYITDSRKTGSASVGADESAGKSDKSDTTNKTDKADKPAASESASKSDSTSDIKSSSASKPTTE
jgi:putative FmdB family regulatory protein